MTWPTTRAEHLVTFIRGHSTSELDLNNTGDGIRYLRTSDLMYGVPKAIEDGRFAGTTPPDPVIKFAGQPVATIEGFTRDEGRSTIGVVCWQGEGLINNHVVKVVSKDPSRLDQRFAEYAAFSEDNMTVLRSGSQGAISQSSGHLLEALSISLPPLEVQRQVASFLDDQVRRIDGIVQARKEQVLALSDFSSSRSEALLTPRVEDQPRWRANRHLAVELATALTPTSWKRKRFKSLLRPLQMRRGEQALPMLSLSSQGYLYDRQGKDDRQQASDETISRNLVVRPGDLVVNPMWITGGSIAVSDRIGTVSPDYRVFRADDDVAAPRFIHHLLRSRPYLDQYRLYTRAETTFDRRVRQDDLDELPIVLPLLTEQVDIADQLDAMDQRTSETIRGLQEVIRQYEDLKRSLISATVSGEFDVSAADGSGVLV